MPSLNSQSPDKKKSFLIAIVRDVIRSYRRLKIIIRNQNRITFGANSYVGSGADFYIPESAVINNNVSIGGNCLVQTNLMIGANSLISSNVSFIGNDHDLGLNADSAYHSGRNRPSNIVLEGNNFVGFGSTLLGSIHIGEGAIIGAGSFVNKDVAAGTVVAGVPAKVVKLRSEL